MHVINYWTRKPNGKLWRILMRSSSLVEHDKAHESKYQEEEREYACFLNKYAVYVPEDGDPFFVDQDITTDFPLCGNSYLIDTGNIRYNFLGDTQAWHTFLEYIISFADSICTAVRS